MYLDTAVPPFAVAWNETCNREGSLYERLVTISVTSNPTAAWPAGVDAGSKLPWYMSYQGRIPAECDTDFELIFRDDWRQSER